MRPPLINSHSFMQTLTNQMWRTVSNWLLIGLNLYERMCINPIGHTFGLNAVIGHLHDDVILLLQ